MISFKQTDAKAPGYFTWKMAWRYKFDRYHLSGIPNHILNEFKQSWNVVDTFMTINSLFWYDDLHDSVFGKWESPLRDSLFFFRSISEDGGKAPKLADWRAWWKEIQLQRAGISRPPVLLTDRSYLEVEEFLSANGIYHCDDYVEPEKIKKKRKSSKHFYDTVKKRSPVLIKPKDEDSDKENVIPLGFDFDFLNLVCNEEIISPLTPLALSDSDWDTYMADLE